MTTKTDTQKAWADLADHLSALGLKLKLHVEEASAELRPSEEVKDAFHQLGSAIEGAFSAIGDAFEDPGVRDDAIKATEALREALADSLAEGGQQVAEAVRSLRCERHAG